MELPRCPAHGLVNAEGCPRCKRETEEKKGSGLIVAVSIVIAIAVFGMAILRAVTAVRDRADRPVATAEPSGRRDPSAAAPAPRARDPLATPEQNLAAEIQNVPVTIYTADYCGWCRKAKAHMTQKGIAFSERKIDESAEAKRDMRRLGGSGVPTFDIEGEVHSGYDPAWVERTIRARAARRMAP